MFRKSVSVITAIAVLLILSSTALAENAPSSGISFNIERNDTLMEDVQPSSSVQTRSSSGDISSISMNIINLTSSSIPAELTFYYQNEAVEVDLCGRVDTIGQGYVGVFKGYWQTSSQESPTLLTVDFSYTASGNAFAALTIGVLSATCIPEIILFGDYTSETGALYEDYAEMIQADTESGSEVNPSQASPQSASSGIDAQVHYISSCSLHVVAPGTAKSYEVATLSLFAPSEAYNTGNSTAYVKINSDCDAFHDFLLEAYEFQASDIFNINVDEVNLTLRGSNDFHAVTNSYLPQNSQTTVDIPIPYYSPLSGFSTFDYTLVTSSTTVTISRVPSTSPYNNNKVSWNLTKRQGWSPTQTDGDHLSQTGLSATATFTNEGNVSAPFAQSFMGTGNLTYLCLYYLTASGITPLHITTDTVGIGTSITVHP